MSSARSVSLDIKYSGKNISKKLAPYITSFTFTDIASGSSDSISLKLMDRDKKWMGNWFPSKGSKITPKIYAKNWTKDNDNRKVICGTFVLDDLSYSGRPLTCNVGAVSMPATEGFQKTKRTKVWKKETVRSIAKTIADRYKLGFSYSANTITISSIEQTSRSDSDFLNSLCSSYGLGFKIFANKICIFNEETYENKNSIATIDETDMLDWSYNTTLSGTYTCAKISYTNAKTGKDVTIKVGSGTRIYEVNEKADNYSDAQLKAKAALREQNKNMTTMSVTMMGNPKIYATACVNITGLNKLNGKYYVEQVKHNINSSSGYVMSLSLRYLPSINKKSSSNNSSSGGTSYTIKKGDTLWMLAKKYYGSGVKYSIIYNANKEIIESTAKKHGKSSSDNGHWIYPGTKITIPAE